MFINTAAYTTIVMAVFALTYLITAHPSILMMTAAMSVLVLVFVTLHLLAD